ncbi:MAG TPA: PAS domain S-box protein [Steroidobacteraceae bacterium]|nr:PAS domain S-box protein [Steroidobacteraceae bacterium]
MTTLKKSSLAHGRPVKAAPELPPGASELPSRAPSDPGTETLADTDRRFRLLVESVRDCAIFMIDAHGRVATWNEGAARINGYPAEKIVGRHISCLYTPEDLERGVPAQLLAAAEADGHAESEGWRVRQDGSRFWVSASITAIRAEGGELVGFGKVTRDLTERKQADEALKGLSGRLIDLQDRERRRISNALNDSTSPGFAALISKLYQAQSSGLAEGFSSQLISDSISLAEYLSREIRTVAYLLHPQALESDGLLATLRAHLETFQRQTGTSVVLDLPERLKRLHPQADLALFRVVQECLSSVLHLSGNARARVRLTERGEELILEVGDEGRGISKESLDKARRGIGELGVAVAGIRERMVRLGGALEISSTPSGTRVTATLPLNVSPPS